MGNFYTDVIQPHPSFMSAVRIADPELLEPVMRAAVQAILADALTLDTPLLIFETYRSQARQEMLFRRGSTRLETVGVHHYGLACDLVKNIDGDPSWNGDFTFLRDLAVKHGLISGIDWGEPGVYHDFVDAVHVQRISVAQQPELFAGTWYPDSE